MQCQATADAVSVSVMTKLGYSTIIPRGRPARWRQCILQQQQPPHLGAQVRYRAGYSISIRRCRSNLLQCCWTALCSTSDPVRLPSLDAWPGSLPVHLPVGRSSPVFADETRKLDVRLALSDETRQDDVPASLLHPHHPFAHHRRAATWRLHRVMSMSSLPTVRIMTWHRNVLLTNHFHFPILV